MVTTVVAAVSASKNLSSLNFKSKSKKLYLICAIIEITSQDKINLNLDLEVMREKDETIRGPPRVHPDLIAVLRIDTIREEINSKIQILFT
jgi:hypothetical protein